MNNCPYINKSAVKELALRCSKELRCGKFTRVSGQFLEEINARLAEHVAHKVKSAPGIGKTL